MDLGFSLKSPVHGTIYFASFRQKRASPSPSTRSRCRGFDFLPCAKPLRYSPFLLLVPTPVQKETPRRRALRAKKCGLRDFAKDLGGRQRRRCPSTAPEFARPGSHRFAPS